MFEMLINVIIRDLQIPKESRMQENQSALAWRRAEGR